MIEPAADAALALASTRIIADHSQLCPVWVKRMELAERPWREVMAECNCWIIAESRRSIRVMAERGYVVAEEPRLGL